MKQIATFDAALLVLRLSLAFVFLYAAWKNTENAEAWTRTKREVALLMGGLPEPVRTRLARLGALAGMIMMFGGGLSILLGIEPRLGGLAIAVFSAVGIAIHVKAAGESDSSMGLATKHAQMAAGLKNVVLIGAGLVLVLVGAGSYGFGIDNAGRWLGLPA